MPVVSDKGNWKNRLNTIVADFIATCFGQRMNYIARYYSHRHRIPNFKDPKDLSERVLSSMLSKEFLKYAPYADKVKVREYISSKGFSNLLIKQYGAWPNASLIPWNELPERFILKANNGCGGHLICTDKSKLIIPKTIELMNKTLEKDVKRLKYTEPHYCAIKPLILCEELLGDGITLPTDYKFLCIKGKVEVILTISEREKGTKKWTFDKNWQVLPYIISEDSINDKPRKPEHLKEMVEIAEKLSEDFDFVRVDLYDFQGKIYFGELTFSPLGGIFGSFSTEAIEILGRKFEE